MKYKATKSNANSRWPHSRNNTSEYSNILL